MILQIERNPYYGIHSLPIRMIHRLDSRVVFVKASITYADFKYSVSKEDGVTPKQFGGNFNHPFV